MHRQVHGDSSIPECGAHVRPERYKLLVQLVVPRTVTHLTNSFPTADRSAIVAFVPRCDRVSFGSAAGEAQPWPLDAKGRIVVIVRVTDMGHYEIPEALEDEILTLDVAIDAALTSGDEEAFKVALASITAAVLAGGQLLTDDGRLGAELVIPHPDSSLSEFRLLLDSEAFEC
jgi:hypothetical protein